MSTTKVLREQSGIQYQGVQDKSEADPRDSLINVVFFGQFKRGRVDRPFKVTKANYRSKLGNDPKNKDFQAVEDALNTGVPFVWVQRISSGTYEIKCDGAMDHIIFNENYYEDIDSCIYEIIVNGVSYGGGSFLDDDIYYYINNHPDLSTMMNADADGYLEIENIKTDQSLKVQIKFTGPVLPPDDMYVYHTGSMAYHLETKEGKLTNIYFCLSPYTPK